MAEPLIGQIIIFAGTFPIRAYGYCSGQLLAISQNDALFSLLGCQYGGDCRTTFALPDLRGRIPVHHGHGPGLPLYKVAQKGGGETVTLTSNQMPNHDHTSYATNDDGDNAMPAAHLLAHGDAINIYTDDGSNSEFNSNAVSHTGGSQSHNNIGPSLVMSYQIAMFGVYPSRH